MNTATYEVLDDDLWQSLVDHKLDFDRYLFLEPHDQLVRYWSVEGNDPTFEVKLDGTLTRFGAVSVFDWERFAEACDDQGYHPVFVDDPTPWFEWREALNGDPGVRIESSFEGQLDREGNPIQTINGFLPFQAQGVNFMRSQERACYGQWSTGTGKTVLAEATILTKLEAMYDLVLYVNKPNNLFDAQKKLKLHTGEEAIVLEGTPKVRETILNEIEEAVVAGEQPTVILNAEKFKVEKDALRDLVEDRRLVVVFDEMPTKYANRATDIYRATSEVLYTSFTVRKNKKIFYPQAGKDRPSEVFYLALSATSVRNSPEDVFNCVRMMDSRIFGSINDFHNMYVRARDPWGKIIRWRNLDYFGARYSHIVHLADKRRDPRIAAQFPKVLPPETVWCGLSDVQAKLYAKLQDEYRKIGDIGAVLSSDEILAAIGCFQMIVDNPRAVLDSAIKYDEYLKAEDQWLRDNPKAKPAQLRAWRKKNKKGSQVAHKLRLLIGNDAKFTDKATAGLAKGECVIPKMIELRDRIEQHDDKVIVFSEKNDMLIPFIEEWFDHWGVTYVTFKGGMTAKAKQTVKETFREDPEVKVFLSTDAGQDSIDLPQASLTIHYNEPWTMATKIQRGNRQHRIDSEKEEVREVTLSTPNTVEDRRAQILSEKQGYQDQIDGQIVEMAEAMQKQDLIYILTGE